MAAIIGCVDSVTHQGITGWIAAVPPEENAIDRFVRVCIDGVELGTIRANLFRPDLRDARISNGRSGFHFLFPTVPNALIDHVIEVWDRDTDAPVSPSPVTLKSLVGSAAADTMLEFDRSLVSAHIGTPSFSDGVWTVRAELIGSEELVIEPRIRNGQIHTVEVAAAPDEVLGALGIQRQSGTLEITADGRADVVFLELIRDASAAGRYAPVCRLALPSCIPGYLSGISPENIGRVSHSSARDSFAARGVNTAYRIDSILRSHFAMGLDGFSRALDWGIGPGRVALPIKRLIAPQISISGADVDEFNINFGKATYPDIEFVLSPFYPPLPFEDNTFDLIFGISVVTHLTESAQRVWLKELQRIAKPDAPVILTVHGEYAILNEASRDPTILSDASLRGISDHMLDPNLGPKLPDKTYYRATFQTRKYVARTWIEHFDVLAHYSCACELIQDYVVLRAR